MQLRYSGFEPLTPAGAEQTCSRIKFSEVCDSNRLHRKRTLKQANNKYDCKTNEIKRNFSQLVDNFTFKCGTTKQNTTCKAREKRSWRELREE
jgi:hypothetical protein